MADLKLPVSIVARACAGLATACLVTSCGPMCDRSGCDAFVNPSAASSITTGVVGVVALRSDNLTKGCDFSCGFSSTAVGIWQTPTTVVDEPAAQALVTSRPPDVTLQADRRYEQALAPGDYLVCGAGTCVALTIGPNEVYTVNFLLQMAMTQTNVWAPSAGQEMEEEFHVDWH